MFRLAYTAAGENRFLTLNRERATVGRQEGNDLVLSDHTVSRRHAEFVRAAEGFMVKDLGARNGVSVNGNRVQQALLKVGDIVTLGLFELRFEEELSERVRIAPSQTESPVPSGTIIRSVDEIRGELEAAGLAQPPPGQEAEQIGRLARNSKILAVLADMSRTLISAKDLNEVLEKIMDVIMEHVQAQRGVLLLSDPHTGELAPRVVRQAASSCETIQISQTIARKAFDEGVAILTQDAQMDERFQAGMSIRMLGIRSALCVPLKLQEKVLGLIYVDTPLKAKAYAGFDLDLLSALAGFGAVAIQQAELRARLQEERVAKLRLERYHSPAVVAQILSSGESSGAFTLEVREMNVSVLFADIVGFTTLSEDMAPREVALLLNDYFSRMAEVIFKHDGTLDKFIGDAIMAVFGAPIEAEDHAARAVRCALEMREALKEFNEGTLPGRPPLNFRIGINSGHVVAGDIGSVRRMEYSVLGNTVNLASRFQSEVAAPGQIAVGEATFQACKSEFKFEKLSKVKVKGISKPITAYEVTG